LRQVASIDINQCSLFSTKQNVYCGPFILHCSIGVLSVQYGVYKSINISRQRNSNSLPGAAPGQLNQTLRDLN
jgi:hypothetical protein